MQSLPAEMAEEARQETVRIIKSSSRPRNNITTAEREALRTLKNNTDLTILLADKGNATVILNTADYKQKITSILEDPSYRRLTRDPTDSTERETALLLKKIHSYRRYMQTTASVRLQTLKTVGTSKDT